MHWHSLIFYIRILFLSVIWMIIVKVPILAEVETWIVSNFPKKKKNKIFFMKFG